VASQAHQVCIASLKHVLLCQRKSTTHYGANVSNFVIIYLLRWGVLRRSAMIKGVTINTINILRGLLKTNEHYPQAWWSKHEHSACPVPNGLKSFVNSAAKVAIAHCRRQSDRAEVFNPVIGRSKNDGTLEARDLHWTDQHTYKLLLPLSLASYIKNLPSCISTARWA